MHIIAGHDHGHRADIHLDVSTIPSLKIAELIGYAGKPRDLNANYALSS